MKRHYVKYVLLALCLCVFVNIAEAQKKKKRTAVKRGASTTVRKTKGKTKASIKSGAQAVDTVAVAPPPPPPPNDSLPIKTVRKSLRPEEAVDTKSIRDRAPLVYEDLRADDAVYRHKIWRVIDAREKMNLPFRYSADENNGNQRFISILFQAIQDSAVTVFSSIDDRFTTPMSKEDVAKAVSGPDIEVPIIDSNGVQTGVKKTKPEVNLDSFYKFKLKEEVIFDKESSRLFWRILGIAPLRDVITSQGIDLGEAELFWVYYPDMRPIFAKYDVYNGKNFGARMSWEDLFESRQFSGRIVKSTIDNPMDVDIRAMPGLTDNTVFQLLEGERLKDKIFNYEQDLWSY
ncbi:MAG TPA: gliding motility protein GldN [Ferruginibacter sp.]|nr:gliding motility protein GldN [Ferruginibacter sp.]